MVGGVSKGGCPWKRQQRPWLVVLGQESLGPEGRREQPGAGESVGWGSC